MDGSGDPGCGRWAVVPDHHFPCLLGSRPAAGAESRTRSSCDLVVLARARSPAPADLGLLSARRHPATEAQHRTPAQRDRDRVLYSSAFLRLGHVTQVASPEIGHIFHSRLTHSLKVGQVSRRIAERLEDQRRRGAGRRLVEALDPDAVEAADLAHDLGHPPFGHLAEQELESLAHGFGGFEGNAQSFRIVTRLSLRSFTEPGPNLTRQTLNGLLKYPVDTRHVDHRSLG